MSQDGKPLVAPAQLGDEAKCLAEAALKKYADGDKAESVLKASLKCWMVSRLGCLLLFLLPSRFFPGNIILFSCIIPVLTATQFEKHEPVFIEKGFKFVTQLLPKTI